MSAPASPPAAKSPVPGLWALVLALVLLGSLAVWRFTGQGALDAADYAASTNRVAIVTALKADAHRVMTTAGWVDKEKGVVRIPVSNAVELTIAELRAKPVQAAGAIPAQGVYGPGVKYPNSFEDPAVAAAATSTNAPKK